METVSIGKIGLEKIEDVSRRTAQPLARNVEQRNRQLGSIAEKPLEHQVNRVATLLRAEDATLSADESNVKARAEFAEVQALLEARKTADATVDEARWAAIKAPRGTYATLVAAYREAKDRRTLIIEGLKEKGQMFQEAGVQLEPAQQQAGFGEKVAAVGDKVHYAVGDTRRAIAEGASAAATRLGEVGTQVGGAVGGGVSNVAEWGRGAGQAIGTGVDTGVRAVGSGLNSGARAVGSGVSSGVRGAAEIGRGAASAGSEAARGFASDASARARLSAELYARDTQRTGETVVGLGRRAVEGGRNGFRSMFNAAAESVRTEWEETKISFNNIKDLSAEAFGPSVQAAKGGLDRLAGIFGGAAERTKNGVTSAWKATEAWGGRFGQEVSGDVKAAGAGIDSFVTNMRAQGESARASGGEFAGRVGTWIQEIGGSADRIQKGVRARIVSEIQVAADKARIFVAPAWEGIQRDREAYRMHRDVMGEKLALLAESTADFATPIVDRILDQGRDARDGAIGLSKSALEGIRRVGRGIGTNVAETTSPIWQSINERLTDWRLRGNEARGRLNRFLAEAGGITGDAFNLFGTDVAAATTRAGEILAGVRSVGGKVVDRGGEVSADVAKKFAERSAAGREWLDRQKESTSEALDQLQRFWELYAVEKWQKAELPNLDLQRRLRVMRAVGAASAENAARMAGRVGSMGAAVAVETVSTRGGRIGVSALAIMALIALNPGLRENVSSVVREATTNVLQLPQRLPDIGMPDIRPVVPAPAAEIPASVVSSPTAEVASTPTPVDVAPIEPTADITPPVEPATVQAAAEDITQVTPAEPAQVVPAVAEAAVTEAAPINNAEAITGLGAAATTPEAAAATPVTAENDAETGPIRPRVGAPIEVQAFQRAKGDVAEYDRLLVEALNANRVNFQQTANAMLQNPAQYTRAQLNIARAQLDAIQRLQAKGANINPRNQQDYQDLMQGMHFARAATPSQATNQ